MRQQTKTTIKVQIPIDIELKKAGERIAKDEGLSSYQELIRYWTKQADKGNLHIRTDHDEYTLSPEADARYNKMIEEYEADLKKGVKCKSYRSAKELFKYLNS